MPLFTWYTGLTKVWGFAFGKFGKFLGCNFLMTDVFFIRVHWIVAVVCSLGTFFKKNPCEKLKENTIFCKAESTPKKQPTVEVFSLRETVYYSPSTISTCQDLWRASGQVHWYQSSKTRPPTKKYLKVLQQPPNNNACLLQRNRNGDRRKCLSDHSRPEPSPSLPESLMWVLSPWWT